MLPPPALVADGPYADRPQPRADDWSGQVRTPHADLIKSWSALVSGGEDDDGGLKRHPGMTEHTPAKTEPERAPDAGILDDDFDPNDARRMDDLARNVETVQRAHAMDQADDDLIPSF